MAGMARRLLMCAKQLKLRVPHVVERDVDPLVRAVAPLASSPHPTLMRIVASVT